MPHPHERPAARRTLPALAAVVLLTIVPLRADQTVGLFLNGPSASEGYTLFAPLNHGTTYLIDNEGRLIHTWPSTFDPGFTAYLQDNGDLVRAIAGGGVQRIAWDGTILWNHVYSTADYRQHHDIEPLPNGNVLLIVWDFKTAADAIAAGRNPANTDPDFWTLDIVEVQPSGISGGQIVWEWHAWDHLIQDFDPTKQNFGPVGNHPELIDVNIGGNAEFIHANAIDYNGELDQILISAAFVGEIWVLDHSTTTAEAAGHTGGDSGKGGDLLYRWGNPVNYRRGVTNDRRLFQQHDARWIEPGHPGAGNITVFNNGGGRPEGTFSSVDEIVTPVDANGDYPIGVGLPYDPPSPSWSYVATPPFYAFIMSGAHRLPNGHTLVANGPDGDLTEVTPAGEIVWRYVSPVSPQGPVAQGQMAGTVFRAERYPPDHPGFDGRDLTPGDPVEFFNEPPPVADGTSGTEPLLCSRESLAGDEIRCSWDAASCTNWSYNLLYGNLGSVPAYSLLGAECGLGVVGTHPWNGVPAADLFFLVVGTDELGIYESSWGRDAGGAQRNATTPSNLCGVTTKDVSSTCP